MQVRAVGEERREAARSERDHRAGERPVHTSAFLLTCALLCRVRVWASRVLSLACPCLDTKHARSACHCTHRRACCCVERRALPGLS
eukprot:701590-Rhodomonas_salina.1